MKNIICIGGQGFIKECIYYLSLVQDINIKGYIAFDDFVPAINNDIKFLGSLKDYKPDINDYFLITAGSPILRFNIYENLKKINAKFYTLLYNTTLNSTIDIGEANVFINCDLTVDIKIGNCNLFNNKTSIGHDANIGDCNFVAPNVQILGNARIGSVNLIGTSTCFLPNSKIGNYNKIAPLSCIYKGCKDNNYISGNPALKVGDTL